MSLICPFRRWSRANPVGRLSPNVAFAGNRPQRRRCVSTNVMSCEQMSAAAHPFDVQDIRVHIDFVVRFGRRFIIIIIIIVVVMFVQILAKRPFAYERSPPDRAKFGRAGLHSPSMRTRAPKGFQRDDGALPRLIASRVSPVLPADFGRQRRLIVVPNCRE